ncbi:hypothetical protein P154DRAFT_218473 [Amniculicola lignicola CBS 123094]|uniref:Uncharacterized protein n=1 Tax=Amniculicola lignicola CBS 123094 TaxID=1392246 RepID=A0A6A5WXG5_9PLEO|nr:hypothetical protein P154DRAFT_218473 [Amniculicola lignicola CBS 123094]
MGRRDPPQEGRNGCGGGRHEGGGVKVQRPRHDSGKRPGVAQRERGSEPLERRPIKCKWAKQGRAVSGRTISARREDQLAISESRGINRRLAVREDGDVGDAGRGGTPRRADVRNDGTWASRHPHSLYSARGYSSRPSLSHVKAAAQFAALSAQSA